MAQSKKPKANAKKGKKVAASPKTPKVSKAIKVSKAVKVSATKAAKKANVKVTNKSGKTKNTKAPTKKPTVAKPVKGNSKKAIKSKALKATPKKAAEKKTITATPTKAPKKASVGAEATKPKALTPKGSAWLQPLDDRILVELCEEPQVSPGGIILVDSSTQPDNVQGLVLAVGRGHQSKKGRIRPVEVKKGDKIIFSKYSGDKVSLHGVNFVIIRESEILGFASH